MESVSTQLLSLLPKMKETLFFEGVDMRISGATIPDPREDPQSRSLKGVPIKYPLVATVPNSGIYFLDPPAGLGLKYHAIAVNASS